MDTIKPVCTTYDGDKFWRLNDKLHREDGPAIEYNNGSKCWYLNDKLHREDGPAMEYINGDKFYFLNDVNYSFEEWDRLRKLPWML